MFYVDKHACRGGHDYALAILSCLTMLSCARNCRLTVRSRLHAVQPLPRVLQAVVVALPQQVGISQVPQFEHLHRMQRRKARNIREDSQRGVTASSRGTAGTIRQAVAGSENECVCSAAHMPQAHAAALPCTCLVAYLAPQGK